MAKAPKPYTRLTRNASGLGSYSSLWLGSDHLMIVVSTGYTESYARLEFRDVKGFFLAPSNRRANWRVVWGVAALSFAIAAVAAGAGGLALKICGACLGLALVGLVWNELLGPGCRAYVVTGVQTARLPSLVRMKKTRRVFGRLQLLIEAAQADLVPAQSPPPAEPPGPPALPPVLP